MGKEARPFAFRKLLFIGLSGREYPHTRVRCYNFADILSRRIETKVLSFKEDLAGGRTEADMYKLRDREKIALVLKALGRLSREKDTIFYVQKAHFHSAAPYLLHRILRRSYIFDYDDYDIPLSNFFVRGLYNRLFFGTHRWDEITFRLARNARCCIASSHFLLEFLKDHNPNVHLVETGVDTDLFFPAPEPPRGGPVRCLWNGLIWGKPIFDNVSFLLDCFSRAAQDCGKMELLIVAGGDWLSQTKDLIAARYNGFPIRVREWVKPSEMPEILRQADVGLLPLIQSEPWFQAKSPTKLYEYLASGLAVVASPTGEVSHIIEPGISGIPAADRQTFTQALIDICKDSSLRHRLSKGARTRAVNRYSLEVLGRRLEHALEGVLLG